MTDTGWILYDKFELGLWKGKGSECKDARKMETV